MRTIILREHSDTCQDPEQTDIQIYEPRSYNFLECRQYRIAWHRRDISQIVLIITVLLKFLALCRVNDVRRLIVNLHIIISRTYVYRSRLLLTRKTIVAYP